MKIISYVYEADCHCLPCTQKRFMASRKLILLNHRSKRAGRGSMLDSNLIRLDQEDCEDNLVHPVFSTDESPSSHCWTCRKEIQ